MRRQKHQLTDAQAGELDEFDGRAARCASEDYRAGYERGQARREEVHARMNAAVLRARLIRYGNNPSEN